MNNIFISHQSWRKNNNNVKIYFNVEPTKIKFCEYIIYLISFTIKTRDRTVIQLF